MRVHPVRPIANGRPLPILRGDSPRLLALAMLVLVAACDERPAAPSPTVPELELEAETSRLLSERPHYLYSGRKIFLDPVPDQFVVRTDLDDPVPAANEALEELGLTATSGRHVTTGHRILEVNGAGADSAREIGRLLHDHPDFPFASPVYRTAEHGEEVVPLDALMVRFLGGVSASEIDALMEELGTRIVREAGATPGLSYYTLAYPETGETNAMALAAALAEHPLTEWADPNKATERRFFGTGEEYFEEQWYLDSDITRNGVPVDINVEPAWSTTTGTFGVKVVVLDEGIQDEHEDVNAFGCGDFLEVGGSVEPEAGTDETHPNTGDDHGTSVAGIIAAKHNGAGVAGIAPGVNLTSIRVGTDGDVVSDDKLADAIHAAWEQCDADVINNSWGSHTESDMIQDEIETATQQGRGGDGTPVVFSAGNASGEVAFPAKVPAAIAVSATDSLGNLASFSNSGPEIDITALASGTGPCVGDIVTAELMGSGQGECNDGPGGDVDYTSTFGGTSAAAPQVVGAIALLLSEEGDLMEAEVRQRLADSADPWGSSDKFGAGKLNVGRLVNGPSNESPTATISAPTDGGTFTEGESISFSGSGDDPEDGSLTGSSLVWDSDLDGQIGTDESFTKSNLSVGTHTITLTATDSEGATGSDQITITVEPAPSPNDPPTATISAPTDGATFTAGESITFSGSGDDPEDGSLTGSSLVWDSDLDGEIGDGESFSRSDLSVGTHTITLTATDSDGASDIDQVSITVETAPNESPTATISAPSNGAIFTEGESIFFSGSGDDPEDGSLTGSSLVWDSDLDGQIGDGESFSRSDLSVGTHTITLTATDSDGATGTDQHTITVEESCGSQVIC